jgi:hypothetical protein
MSKVYVEEHTIFGDHSITWVSITKAKHIWGDQIANVRPCEIVLSIAVFLAGWIMLSQIQLKGFIGKSTHTATIDGVNAGVVLGVFDNLYITDHIVDW